MTPQMTRATPARTAPKTDETTPFDYSDLPRLISNAVEAMPDLSTYGFRFSQRSGEQWNEGDAFERNRARMFSDDFAWQVMTALACLRAEHPREYALRVVKRSSYGLKHSVEWWVRREGYPPTLSNYVSNGALIVAAYIDGWKIAREENSPNCGFRRGVAK